MVYWIGNFAKGRLGTMARPRGGDWLADEAAKLVALDAHVVVSALTRDEEEELELQEEATLFHQAGLTYLSHPIGDRLIPDFNHDFKKLIHTCVQYLEDGKSVVTHCRMGIGRASLLAASIMVCMGVDPKTAYDQISEKRGIMVPDTLEQFRWVQTHQSQLIR